MQREVEDLVVGDLPTEPGAQELTDPPGRGIFARPGRPQRLVQLRRRLLELLALLLPVEEVAQVRDEPGHRDGPLVDDDVVLLPDDREDPLQQLGHLQRRVDVAGPELRVDEVQGQRHRLDVRQPDAAFELDEVQRLAGHRDLRRVEVVNLPPQRVLDLGRPLGQPTQGEADVVGHRDDDEIGDVGAQRRPSHRNDPLGQLDVGQRHLTDQRGQPVGGGDPARHERALDSGRVDVHPR